MRIRSLMVPLAIFATMGCEKKPPKTTVDVDTMREASFVKDGKGGDKAETSHIAPYVAPPDPSPAPTNGAKAETEASSDPIAESRRSTAKPKNGAGSGISLGARLGFMLPFGESASGLDMSRSFGSAIPLILDAGYRVTPNVYVGIYGQYALAFASSDSCGPSASCSAYDIRVGANAHYHFAPGEKIDPWAGIGAGYEWAGVSATANGAEASTSTRGFELFNVQAGADFASMRRLGAGPYASFGIGQFTASSLSTAAGSSSGSIEKTGLHEWLTLGFRAQYDL